MSPPVRVTAAIGDTFDTELSFQACCVKSPLMLAHHDELCCFWERNMAAFRRRDCLPPQVLLGPKVIADRIVQAAASTSPFEVVGTVNTAADVAKVRGDIVMRRLPPRTIVIFKELFGKCHKAAQAAVVELVDELAVVGHAVVVTHTRGGGAAGHRTTSLPKRLSSNSWEWVRLRPLTLRNYKAVFRFALRQQLGERLPGWTIRMGNNVAANVTRCLYDFWGCPGDEVFVGAARQVVEKAVLVVDEAGAGGTLVVLADGRYPNRFKIASVAEGWQEPDDAYDAAGGAEPFSLPVRPGCVDLSFAGLGLGHAGRAGAVPLHEKVLQRTVKSLELATATPDKVSSMTPSRLYQYCIRAQFKVSAELPDAAGDGAGEERYHVDAAHAVIRALTESGRMECAPGWAHKCAKWHRAELAPTESKVVQTLLYLLQEHWEWESAEERRGAKRQRT